MKLKLSYKDGCYNSSISYSKMWNIHIFVMFSMNWKLSNSTSAVCIIVAIVGIIIP